ncbi:hypothetical protein TVAG_185130 [Trichomonas vaginalis G3]|uniref:SNF7 family protein n=1 Tax=Trichomonas vaginalis (strain ATCC PRA-98 / G3) TaxID=412133 RepID=A2D8F8_TRIV3|nr:hypothetical protein TVAGG3_0393270 [Trichomonas vaginalis G3]EAY23207.1 hypothetical protein TVAG_185130 [Trichomonas vaginalis G3]KAI5534144.1 hypothetical protein TVAGG3_0393270 [Trichomonas vaginalis G3]|eukprot:XP_001584193.1 hypothetical protein [Trichomonas vaginalis G3]
MTVRHLFGRKGNPNDINEILTGMEQKAARHEKEMQTIDNKLANIAKRLKDPSVTQHMQQILKKKGMDLLKRRKYLEQLNSKLEADQNKTIQLSLLKDTMEVQGMAHGAVSSTAEKSNLSKVVIEDYNQMEINNADFVKEINNICDILNDISNEEENDDIDSDFFTLQTEMTTRMPSLDGLEH